jgi:hypothetical protein
MTNHISAHGADSVGTSPLFITRSDGTRLPVKVVQHPAFRIDQRPLAERIAPRRPLNISSN